MGDKPLIHTDEWFDMCFADYETGRPRPIPPKLRAAATHICRSYGISGTCDPMYIANTIAMRLGMGDGQGNFNKEE